MPEPHPIRPCIYLDYGADAIDPADAACELCERGMRFCSPWQFTVGSLLHICFAFEEEAPCRIEVEGCVVECLCTGDKEHLTTLAFVEMPGELRAMLGKVFPRLAFRPRSPV